MAQKRIAVQIRMDGKTRTFSRVPPVKLVDGAYLEIRLPGNTIVRLAPDVAKRISGKYSEWQFDTYA